MLLSGMCRLGFEHQTFVPDGNSARICWLEVSEGAGAPLAEMLGPDWRPEFDEFHAEFWGVMYWTPEGSAHFNMSKSFARMDELVSARILPPATSPPVRTKHNGIRARLEAGSTTTR